IHCGGTELVRRVEANPDRVYWSETRALRWDDFQGTPVLNQPEMVSEIVIWQPSGIERKNLFGKLKVSVECYMDKKSSWVDRERATEALLFYNQVIFDIYELYTRKLRQALMTNDLLAGDGTAVFNQLAAENGQLLQLRLQQYRTESDLGRDVEVTKQWFRQIRSEIRELAAYR
ncbi:MAG: hypothetical protein D6743_09495, partial [Calditrichaeota bacterium]